MNTKSFINELKKEVEEAKRVRVTMISEKRRAQSEFNELAETATAVTRSGSRTVNRGRTSTLKQSRTTGKNTRIQTRTVPAEEEPPQEIEKHVTFESMDIIIAKLQSARLKHISHNAANRVTNI